MAKIIGIDLGTSNSAAAVMEGGRPTIIPSAEGTSIGGKAFPSYVAFTKDGQLLVGEPARRQAVTNPEGTIAAIKRKMGTDYKVKVTGQGVHAPADLRFHPAEDQAGRRGLPGRDGHQGGHHRARLLQRQPEAGHQGRRRHRRPGGGAGSSTSRPRPLWPTAWTRPSKAQKIMVFDLGGGTLDVTIMEFSEGVFEVISTSGDTQLGGTDMDEVLINVRRQQVPEGDRHRPHQGQDGHVEGPRGLREGQDRALHHHVHRDQPAVHHRRRERAEAPVHEPSPGPSWRSWSTPSWSAAAAR